MQIKREQLNPTTIKLTITADQAVLSDAKQHVLKHLALAMKLPGFRPGKAPLSIVERNADTATLQSEFLDEALNRLYSTAVEQEKLRPVAQPQVSLQKFVPFTDLEISAEVEVVGDVKLPDYKKFKLAKPAVVVNDKDVDEVIENLRARVAEKKDIDRAAASGDEATIDFKGTDAKTNEPVKGADGQGYPLLLGSDTFIPGFETNVIGMKAGEVKTFVLTFPKDYGVKALQNRKVSFEVNVSKVQELVKPKVDDKFAASVGPFKTVKALREDITKQLTSEKQEQATREYQDKLLEMLADKTTVAVPKVLIDDEIERMTRQLKQNLTYRGQTWPEYLEDQSQTDEEYRESQVELAERHVKAGLALSEVAEQEGITVTPEEFQLRLQLLKGQYTDKMMQAELEKPENARSIISSMLSEKTIAKLEEYAASK